jgi:hypothetical protein
MEVVALGKVLSGKLELNNRKGFIRDLVALEGLEVMLTVEKKKKKRSNQQSRYYWGCVIPSIRHAMESKGFLIQNNETIHDLLKVKFLKGEIVNLATGEIIETLGSTTRLTTIAFEEYLEQIRAWAAQYLDCVVPLPNEQTEIFNN